MKKLFYNGVFHSMKDEKDTFYAMEVEKGRIKRIFRTQDECAHIKGDKTDLGERHVYPCLIDSHIHMFMTILNMATGFRVCEITSQGVKPDNLKEIENRIREYACGRKRNEIIAATNYIVTAVDVKRLPTREELDRWTDNRPAVVYSIDGHSCSLSSEMLKIIGKDHRNHSGILQGEENEVNQGKITDAISSRMNLRLLAAGMGRFHNYCAGYGIGMVCALEGYGDSENDKVTDITAKLASHSDIAVRLFPQYTDYGRGKRYSRYMKDLRTGGCGDWEMDGAVGSHSAAFSVPYKDTGEISPCYYSEEEACELCRKWSEKGYQISSHAIGDAAVKRLVRALSETEGNIMHRIEHGEFIDEETVKLIAAGKYALVMQPGYSWIDGKYLHSYEQHLSDEMIKMMRLKTLYDKGVCICGSSDSPVQEMNPFIQMAGMVSFYNREESISPYEAFRAYTVNGAKAALSEDEYGTLEEGKRADFFISEKNFFDLEPEEIQSFLPDETYYGGRKYRMKKGTVYELIKMMMKKAGKI